MSPHPNRAGTIVVGGGSAGAAVAGVLADAGEDVLLLEAGPDYGPFDRAAWPADLLDARALPSSHDAGHATRHGDRRIALERARVIGGCSSHNGCAAIWGHRADYDGWAAAGNPGWSAAELAPVFARICERLRFRDYPETEVTPFHRACLEAGAALGWARSADLNDLEEDSGFGVFGVNVDDGIRWNTAFAYLDPVRDRIRVRGGAQVSRVLFEQGRAVGVMVDGEATRADRVVVCAGTYDSPALLLRSGVGPADQLRAAGIRLVAALDGVGENLQDHPLVVLRFGGSAELERRMAMAGGWVPEEQSLAKLRSRHCEEAFDVHVAPIGGPTADGGWRWELTVGCMDPRSRGTVRLDVDRPDGLPVIDVAFLSDAGDHDRRVLIDGIALARELAATSPLGALLGNALDRPEDDLDAAVTHYFHPVGTCAMGPDSAAGAVVDHTGSVHGVEGLFVADCSIMPTIPRGNTNIPAVAVGEQVAQSLVAAAALA